MTVQIANEVVQISGDGQASTHIGLFLFSDLLQSHLKEDPFTRHLEGFVTNYISHGMPQAETQLVVRMICAWGGLRGENPRRLYEANIVDDYARLTRSLITARELSMQGRCAEGIRQLSNVRGVGISFQSKFLKFLCPDHAAVLDSKMRGILKYDQSPAGYAALVDDCTTIRSELNTRGFKRDNGAPWRTSDVEMAIFMKIR